MNEFPLAKKGMTPVETFLIKGANYDLYLLPARPRDCPYSLYRRAETNPVQHNMTVFEVFNQLAQLLNEDRKTPKVIAREALYHFFIHGRWYTLIADEQLDKRYFLYLDDLLHSYSYGSIAGHMDYGEVFRLLANLLEIGDWSDYCGVDKFFNLAQWLAKAIHLVFLSLCSCDRSVSVEVTLKTPFDGSIVCGIGKYDIISSTRYPA